MSSQLEIQPRELKFVETDLYLPIHRETPTFVEQAAEQQILAIGIKPGSVEKVAMELLQGRRFSFLVAMGVEAAVVATVAWICCCAG